MLFGQKIGIPGGLSALRDFLTIEARRLESQGAFKDAIQVWQDIACLLGEQTPESVYHSLSEAYAKNREGFGGSKEENHCWGDIHKHTVLASIHEQLKPDLYLEIGVDQGVSLALAPGHAIGVDPRPKLKLSAQLKSDTKIISKSSDAFFREDAEVYLKKSPDLVLIDGMHLFEFALRDFINVERWSSPTTLVVIDDIYPCHPTQAKRRRCSGAWTGDVWKLHQILREHRPDLAMVALKSHTTGLLLIAGLDRSNTLLKDNYENIVKLHQPEAVPAPDVLERAGSIASDHPAISKLLKVLFSARSKEWPLNEIKKAISLWRDSLNEIDFSADQ